FSDCQHAETRRSTPLIPASAQMADTAQKDSSSRTSGALHTRTIARFRASRENYSQVKAQEIPRGVILMFDSTRIVLLLFASQRQIGSSFRGSNHPTSTVDPRQRMRGFSVVELLTTVIILLVVSAMAV